MSKRKVEYIQNDEPAFLKRFKEKVGYKEPANIDSKRSEPCGPPNFDDSDSGEEGFEKEEEKPAVVVLKTGDLTADEARAAEEEMCAKPRAPISNKVTFRKPTKSDTEKDTNKKDTTSNKDRTANAKKSKRKSLLSFDEDDE